MIETICIASNNQGKIQEIMSILRGLSINLCAKPQFGIPSPKETGATFLENALLKARHLSEELNLPALADDSGLCIDCLNQTPGLFSASFAGFGSTPEHNIQKVLTAVAPYRTQPIKARLISALCFFHAPNDLSPFVVTQVLHGEISPTSRGEIRGYESIFYVPHIAKTLGELSLEEKIQFSPRAVALSHFKKYLASLKQRNALERGSESKVF